jgi:hypothetical protein
MGTDLFVSDLFASFGILSHFLWLDIDSAPIRVIQ